MQLPVELLQHAAIDAFTGPTALSIGGYGNCILRGCHNGSGGLLASTTAHVGLTLRNTCFTRATCLQRRKLPEG